MSLCAFAKLILPYLRPLRDVAAEQIKAAVQAAGMAGDPHTGGRVSSGIASAHAVADFVRVEMGDQAGNQFWGTDAPVLAAAAGPPVRIGCDAGQGAEIIRCHIESLLP